MAKTPPKLANARYQYWTLFKTCKVKPDKLADVKQIVTQITANRARYESATATITMPRWRRNSCRKDSFWPRPLGRWAPRPVNSTCPSEKTW